MKATFSDRIDNGSVLITDSGVFLYYRSGGNPSAEMFFRSLGATRIEAIRQVEDMILNTADAIRKLRADDPGRYGCIVLE